MSRHLPDIYLRFGLRLCCVSGTLSLEAKTCYAGCESSPS